MYYKRRRYLLRTLLVVGGLMAAAATLFAQKYPIKTYTTADGLPPYAVERILQDHLGNLWMTTAGGLVRYNGKQFLLFTADDGLGCDAVRPIVEDRLGRLWVGTLGGGLTRVLRTSGGAYQFQNILNILPDSTVLSLFIDPDGALWAGTRNGVVRMIRDDADSIVKTESWLAGTSIGAIAQSQDGGVWFGDLDGRLHRLKDGALSSVVLFARNAGGISGLGVDAAGNLWVSSFEKGLLKIPNAGGSMTPAKDRALESIFPRIDHLTADTAGDMWIGTLGGGLFHYDGRRLENFGVRNGLPDNDVVCALRDREGSLWIAAAKGGVCRLSTYPCVYFDKASGLAGDRVRDVIQDRGGAHWVATFDGGVTRYDGSSFRVFSERDGLTSHNVQALMEDSFGRIWAATSGQGVFVFDGRRFTRFRSGVLGDVLCMLEDRDKNLWFGTDRYGAVRYSPGGASVQFTTGQGLAGQRVFHMMEDRTGRIWFACGQPGGFKPGGGLSVWDPDRFLKNLHPFTSYTPANGFPSREVVTVFEDRDRGLWVGTRRDGLLTLRAGRWVAYTKRDGLCSNSVVAITQDSDGRLWAGTAQGLNVWDGKAFQSVTARRGLIDGEVYDNAMIIDRAGALWFGSASGVCRFHIGPPEKPPVAPRVYLDRVWTGGSVLAQDELTQLSYRQNSVDFEVTGIAFRSEKDIRYQYRLDGFDPDWEPPTQRDYVSFTNLDPGRYTFQARAAGSDGLWSEPLAVAVEIHPAFWQTLWFRPAAVLLILIALPFGYRGGQRVVRGFIRWRRRGAIGPYKIKGVIGEGAMGIVYRAYDRTTKMTVALKVIHDKLMSDPDHHERFLREGRILSRLKHPNVVKVFAVGEWNGHGAIAMEILSRGHLRRYIRDHFPLEPTRLSELLVGIAEGLAYLHRQSVVHRDLRSENIMMDATWSAKIMDFGLSKSTLVTTLTQVGTVMGTLGYVAPELITGARADQRSDIFSFGVVMYELLTSRLPFAAENEIALIHAIFNDRPVRPSEIQPGLLIDYDFIALRCLEKDPVNRYPNCDELLSDLHAAAAAQSG